MTSFNTIYYLVLVIIGLCIPIYYLVGRQKFAWYLIILFVGSIVQKAETVLLYPIYPSLSMIIYDMLAIAISISLILFVLRAYINMHVLKEKRFIIFVVTAILGIGLRIMESYNDVAIWTSMLAYYLAIAIVGVGFLMTQNLKKFFKQDWGILLTIIAGALIYIILYLFYQEQSFFYWAWLFVMGIQVAIWLIIGLLHLKTRNAGALPRSSFHQKNNNLIMTSRSFNLFNGPIKSGMVDRW